MSLRTSLTWLRIAYKWLFRIERSATVRAGRCRIRNLHIAFRAVYQGHSFK